MAEHPSHSDLRDGGTAVRAHLQRCPRCRVELRLITSSALATCTVGPPAAEAGPPPAALPTVALDHCVDLGPLGRGGMGEVRRVSDAVLGRAVARKMLREDREDRPGAEAAFLDEARLTAQLEHPGVVPVHALGRMADGRAFFTMREVRGRTLRALALDVHAASPDRAWGRTAEGWGLRRLVEVVRRVAQTVAFAHARGVVHCDLKPSNVMLGDWGEVLVLDWGIASRLEGGPHTGRIAGSPAWMAPEQARGEALSPAFDVMGLGGLLHWVLTARPPLGGPQETLLARAAAGDAPVSPADQTRRPVPPELDRLCCAARQPLPAQRFPSADGFAHALEAWLDGAHKRAQATALVDESHRRQPQVDRMRREAAAADADATARLEALPGWASVEEKRPHWEAQDRARALRRAVTQAEVERIRTLQAALRLDPECAPAHRALAAHHRSRHTAAERAGRVDDAMAAETLLRVHNRGEHDAYLAGRGRLSIRSRPSGAQVRCAVITVEDRRLVPGPERVLGTTPLHGVELPVGSYQLRLVAPGCAPAVVPVEITRLGHWDNVPPGQSAGRPVQLVPEGALQPGEVVVPAGWFRAGGDPDSASATPGRRIWCEGFAIQRHPVTHGDYIAFLDALVDDGREAEALRHAPREHGQAAWSDPDAVMYGRDAQGHFHLKPDAEGDLWELDWPVFLVDGWGARAYARWWSARTGQTWRLPSELEWEKAARGVDGRCFPWGNFLDPTFACIRSSHAGGALPASVDAYPHDCSIYGVRGLGGNLVDRCADVWDSQGPAVEGDRVVIPPDAPPPDGATAYQVAKGGSWFNYPRYARSAGRIRLAWLDRTISVTVRLVRSLAPT